MPAWAFVPIRSPCSCLTLCGAPFERPPDCRSRSERTSPEGTDRKSTRLNSSHLVISYAVFCLKKKNIQLLPVPRRTRLGPVSPAAGGPGKHHRLRRSPLGCLATPSCCHTRIIASACHDSAAPA